MDISKIIKVGDIAQIQSHKAVYTSIIDDVVDENTLSITQPLCVQRKLIPKVDEKYEIHFLSSRGIVICQAVVIKTEYEATVPSITFRIAAEPRRIQRRECYRASIILDTMIKHVDKGNPEEQKWNKARTLDISETGMLLLYGNECAVGENLECQIFLDKFGFNEVLTKLQGVIVRILRPERKGDIYRIGVRFIDVPDRVRYTLLKFITYSQRKDIS